MSQRRAFVTRLGVCSAAGDGFAALAAALDAPAPRLRPLDLFAPGLDLPALPVGHCPEPVSALPRSHALARRAAREALGQGPPPDAVLVGITTGGMPSTEDLLRAGERDPAAYALHGAGTVAEDLAREFGCAGPAWTLSTACSSAALALALALELLRRGAAERVLVGGVDGLCRLTYHGFRLLQLIDPQGAHPLSAERRGMSVGEAAAFLLLEAAPQAPAGAWAELRGAGLSCDAFHATRPQPEGEGALAAMAGAVQEAGLAPGQVDYVNLHGTGTPDNDAAEAKAVLRLFDGAPPALSSTKGLTSHPLAAAGALEAAIACWALRAGRVPASTSALPLDETLGLRPVLEPQAAAVRHVLSNSFGFGGNNAALVFSAPDAAGAAPSPAQPTFHVLGAALLSGGGGLTASLARWDAGEDCSGPVPDAAAVEGLPPRTTRRLKRLPRLVLGLAEACRQAAPAAPAPRSVFSGTAWGPLSETADFLGKLADSGDQFSSPTDFIGSVHNSPAGQVALHFAAKGANVTATCAEQSFEQACWAARLLARPERDEPLLLLGADELHADLSPLFDPLAPGARRGEGGGALLLSCAPQPGAPRFVPTWIGGAAQDDAARLDALAAALAAAPPLAAWLVSWPATEAEEGARRLSALRARLGFVGPCLDLRAVFGEHPAVAAQGAALAVALLQRGRLPGAEAAGLGLELAGQGLALLSLGARAALSLVLPPA